MLKLLRLDTHREARIAKENMSILGIPASYINCYDDLGLIHLINSNPPILITPKTFPELHQFIRTLESEKNLMVYAAFNEPDLYGNPTDMYALLYVQKSVEKDQQFKIQKRGNLCKTITYNWRASDGKVEQSLSVFQIGNGGVWCLPHAVARMVKF